VGKFDEAESVTFSLIINTAALISGPYTQSQTDLFRRVLALRELQKLTFLDIATRLTEQGFLSPRGKPLSAELVFSVYKKGKRRFARMSASPSTEMVDFEIIPNAF
jgi:hypothetical protein